MLDCLIIDDDSIIAGTICEYFSLFDLRCDFETDYAAGLKAAIERRPSIIVLDVNLGEESGFILCKKIREASDVPVIFISVRNTDDDVLAALGVGGDDYVAKPFSMAVLLAKVRAMLKRSVPAAESARRQAAPSTQAPRDIIRFGGVEIDRGSGRATKNGGYVRLKPMELKLLLYLYDIRGKRAEKDELLREVWGDTFVGEGTLSVHIRRLREKLEDAPDEPRYIKTVWGSGYMFEEPRG